MFCVLWQRLLRAKGGAAGENDASVKLTEESEWKIGLAQHKAGSGQAFIAKET